MTVPNYVSEDESDMRGIKPGWYAIEDDGDLSGLFPVTGNASAESFSQRTGRSKVATRPN